MNLEIARLRTSSTLESGWLEVTYLDTWVTILGIRGRPTAARVEW